MSYAKCTKCDRLYREPETCPLCWAASYQAIARAEGAAAERAAIVADIRKWRDDVRSREDGSEKAAAAMDMVAWSIERGDHRKDGTPHDALAVKNDDLCRAQDGEKP